MSFSKELNIGRAGEYLAMADILMQGYQCFDSGQGAKYDLIMENEGGKLLKIQVKTTAKPKKWNSEAHQKTTESYFFHTKRTGKNGTKSYTNDDFDIYALVMMDINKIAYIKNTDMPKASITLRDRSLKYYNEGGANGKSKYYQDYSLKDALK